MKPVVIYGPPCSGKSTYVREQMADSDLVFDYDRLVMASTNREFHSTEKSSAHDLVLRYRRKFIENISGLSAGVTPYVLTRYPTKYLSESLSPYSPEYVPMNTSLDECLERLKSDETRPDKDAWEQVIRDWFDTYDYNFSPDSPENAKETVEMKSVDIKRTAYSLATVDGNRAELTMYGDIYEKRPVDWLTGKTEDGDFILLDEFLDDLREVERCTALTIRMNSYGGDAVVADVIHNRLRELSRNGMALTCIVDGVAMSGGSLIMCACDEVLVNPSSLIMIHNAWGMFFGGYNSQELLDAAARLDAYDSMQASIYARKTGLSEPEIRAMMDETTYMTGTEAVDKGFADTLIEDAEPLRIAASADRRTLFVGNRKLHLAPGMEAPAAMQTMEDPEEWRARMLAKIGKSPSQPVG